MSGRVSIAGVLILTCVLLITRGGSITAPRVPLSTAELPFVGTWRIEDSPDTITFGEDRSYIHSCSTTTYRISWEAEGDQLRVTYTYPTTVGSVWFLPKAICDARLPRWLSHKEITCFVVSRSDDNDLMALDDTGGRWPAIQLTRCIDSN